MQRRRRPGLERQLQGSRLKHSMMVCFHAALAHATGSSRPQHPPASYTSLPSSPSSNAYPSLAEPYAEAGADAHAHVCCKWDRERTGLLVGKRRQPATNRRISSTKPAAWGRIQVGGSVDTQDLPGRIVAASGFEKRTSTPIHSPGPRRPASPARYGGAAELVIRAGLDVAVAMDACRQSAAAALLRLQRGQRQHQQNQQSDPRGGNPAFPRVPVCSTNRANDMTRRLAVQS